MSKAQTVIAQVVKATKLPKAQVEKVVDAFHVAVRKAIGTGTKVEFGKFGFYDLEPLEGEIERRVREPKRVERKAERVAKAKGSKPSAKPVAKAGLKLAKGNRKGAAA